MIILGLHFGHDGAACLVKDGKLIAAISSERLTRKKKSHGFDDATIDSVLRAANIHAEDVDAVALSDYHPQFNYSSLEFTRNGQAVDNTWNSLFGNDLLEFEVKFRGRTLPGYNIGHHLCHCAAAFYTSPFEDAFCMSMDSSGGELKSNFLIAHGQGNTLTALDAPTCMIGLAYGQFTERLGLGPQVYKAGSTMALAGYGEVLPHVVESRERLVSDAFFGGGDYWKWVETLWQFHYCRTFEKADSTCKRARDIAASIQYLFEQTLLEAACRIPAGECANLCLGGGSFLNCNVNSAISRQGVFKNLHLFPACSDDGCSVGAALYVAHALFNEPRVTYEPAELCYLGENRGTNEGADYGRIAEAIAKGKIVAWFQGRAEFGPRALGNRSLLADPCNYHSRLKINHLIKHREWFRPLSPVVHADMARKWFSPSWSPYMLLTSECFEAERLPAVTHIDGSARVQSVKRQDNPSYYDLLSAYESVTGWPLLVNTSLNGQGEPILETEEDARRFWEERPVDMLVLNGEIHVR